MTPTKLCYSYPRMVGYVAALIATVVLSPSGRATSVTLTAGGPTWIIDTNTLKLNGRLEAEASAHVSSGVNPGFNLETIQAFSSKSPAMSVSQPFFRMG